MVKAEAQHISLGEPVSKRFKIDETITFSEADMVPSSSPHMDAIVISTVIANKRVDRVHMDQGSAVNLIYTSYFRKMDLTSHI